MNNFFFKKKNKFLTFKDLHNICNLPYRNNFKNKILDVNNIKDANNSEITFLNSASHLNYAKNSKALTCLVSKKFKKYLKKEIIPLISEQPEIDFYKVVNFFYPNSSIDNEFVDNTEIKNKIKKNIFIGKNSLIDKTAEVGNNVKIGNNVIINPYVKIGNGCHIGSNVILRNVFVGDNVVIKSGTLVGQIGFGFKYERKKRFNFPHIGKVIIENNCQIGSLCTIDRGSLTDTVIGEFSSIDNQVQIAHNVKIGSFCVIASQVGIAGSTILGNNVLIGGQAGVSDHLKIGNNVKIGGKSGVVSDIEDNKIVMGYPAKSLREFVNQNRK
jgi:UDP-3-O-[3-hydroxymyristoyl] glucosamine N-acyltransferase